MTFPLIMGAVIAVMSCSDPAKEEPTPISSNKKIQSFRLNVNYPNTKNITGSIDEDAKKITLNLGIDDEVTGVSATASLSAGATISPDPFVPANYELPVNYVVTAEDQSTASYTVQISRAKMTVTGLSAQHLAPGDVLVINGSNLFTSRYHQKVVLTEGGKEQLLPMEGNTYYDNKLLLKIREDMEIGTYDLKVVLEDHDSVMWPTPVVIDFPNHNTTLTAVEPSKRLGSGDPALYIFSLFVQGRFLGNTSTSDISNAKVWLVKKSDQSFKQELTKQSYGGSDKNTYFGIFVNVPNGTLSAGDYYLDIEFKGQTIRHNQTLTYPW